MAMVNGSSYNNSDQKYYYGRILFHTPPPPNLKCRSLTGDLEDTETSGFGCFNNLIKGRKMRKKSKNENQ